MELIVSSEIQESSAIIKVNELSEDVKKAVNYLENLETRDVLTVKDNAKLKVINIDDIYLIKSVDKKIKVFSETHEYSTNKKLYELENILNKNFIRISKSSIVNIKKINNITPSFKGTLIISLKNNLKDNISRKYLKDFKKKLGMS